MSKRLCSLLFALFVLIGSLLLPSAAAPTLEEAMRDVQVYAKNKDLNWLTMNGSIRTQHYTYYNYTSVQTGEQREIPAYCVDPRLYGVPALVPEGTPIHYSAESTVSDPKVCGIIANGYPHIDMETLGVQNIEEAYYATKTALWIYLLGSWSLDGLGINPNLQGADLAAAQRVLQATRDIYWRGTTQWDSLVSPSCTVTADRDIAYPVTIDGQSYYQQVFTVTSSTWVVNQTLQVSLAEGAPAGTKVVDMNNNPITQIPISTTGDVFQGQCKVLYPASSITGEGGTVQLNVSGTVVQYAIYYATSLETDQYGNIQDYMLDTDPHIPTEASAISRYAVDTPPPPGETALKIVKVEEGTQIPLSGAVFRVVDPNGVPVGSFTTDTTGSVTIPLTQVGHYTIEEITAPEGYLLDEETTQQVQAVHGQTVTVTFENAPYGDLRVEKISDTGEPLNGVTIQIRHIESGATQTGTTQSSGVIQFTQLKPGAYEVREVAGISGWQADTDTVKTVTVVSGETSAVTFTNRELPGLRIVKYDRSTLQVMSNIPFRIWKNNVLLGDYFTDELGEILLTDLQPGTYRVQELESDGEHIADTTPQEIELQAGDGIKSLAFFNDQKPGIHLIKVDSTDLSKPIPNVTFCIESVEGNYSQEFTTDEKGEINLSHLETGAYVVMELSAPGYVVDNAQRILQLSPNETAQFVFTNSVKPSLELKKLSANGLPLEGVTFRISKIEDGTHYLDRTTNAQGEILVSDLEPGVYAVQETATVADHILDSKEYRVELFAGKTSTIVIQNDKRPNLTIRKTDRATGAPLAGVTFTVQHADGSTVTTEPTGADGTVTIENLLPGVYTITEQSVPEGYLLDTTSQQITLEPNRDATVQFQNDKRPTLLLKKVDMDGKPLTGAIFEVKTKAGVELGDFPVGADGTVTIDHVHLEEGYYIITEIQAPSGYILDDTPHEVYLRAGKTTELILKNEKKPGLTIIKQDSVTGEPLQGAKFELWVAKDNNPDGTFQKLEQNYYVTNATGVIELENLDTGWYKIVEVEPPSGYALQNPAEEIIYVEHDKAVEVLFENTPLSALVVYKFDSVTGEALEGAIFQVKYLGGTSGSGGTVIGTYETGVNGSFTITGLKAGTYVVEELKSPDGHVIDTAPQTVYLSGQTQDVVQLYFGNSPKGNLLIQKVDSVTKEPLSDVTFQVNTSEGTVVGNANGKFVTDSSGSILIENLAPGTTLVVNELETKEGYELDQTPQTVTIKAGQTVTLEFRNTPNGSILITKLDSVTKKPLSGVSFDVKGCDGCSFPANTYTTDSNGQILISHVPAGSYVITETVAKEGYLLNNTSQTVKVTAGTCQEVTILNDPLGGLLIKKLDAVTKEPLSEVTFRVTTPDGTAVGNSNGEFRTDENGYISISDLEPGSYVVQEIKAKDGYVLDNTPKTIQIKDYQTYTLEFFNQPKGNLIIQKVDAITKEPLAGVTFKVTTASGELLADNEGFTSTNGLYITDENGQITLSKLNPDTYVVTEVETLDGYLLDAPPQTVIVSAADTQTLTFTNTPKGCLVITKVDSVTKEPLSDVTFQIEGCNGCEYPAGTYTTDSNGQIQLNQIPSGSYSITEVETKTGYLLDNTVKTVTIEGGTCQKVTFENDPLGGLLIKKLDAVTKKPLSEVTFRVTTPDGTAVGSSNGEFRTDENGYISISDLEPGSYVVQEVKAKDGYVLDNTPKTIQIKDHQTYTLEFFNQPAGGLLIKKMDAVTKEPLSEVTFRVTTPDGTAVGNSNGEFRTDENGYISIPDPEPGSYVVQEVKAKDGYVLDNTPKTIQIKDHQTYTLEFFNQPKGNLIIHKLDSVTKTPLEGVEFEITYADGSYVDAEGGTLSSKGRYTTDENGQIILSDLTGTIVVTETKTIEGYTIHEESRSQTVVVNPHDTQELIFYNDPIGGVELIKVDEADKTRRLANATFEIRKMDDALVDTVTTDKNGRVFLSLENGAYYAVEIEAPEGYRLDDTPHYFEVKEGKTSKLTITNKAFSGILIHKTDSTTGEGIYGVTFLLYDSGNQPIGQYTSDDRGYVYIENLESGRYYLRELENEGYLVDTQQKTVQVTSGETTLVEWENTPIMGQIQIIKKSADDNPINALPAGTLLEGAVFEIYDKAGNVVDTIVSDRNGRAISKLLPLSRYTIREIKAPDYYAVNPTVLNAYLEYEGQILTFEVENSSVATGVSIQKTGYAEVMPNQPIQYTITEIGNTSTVPLSSFYWRDTLPSQVQLSKVVTGTFNQQLSYKIVYKTNLNGNYQTLADSLSTTKNYVLEASPAALELAANERVTELMFIFGTVKGGFGQVEPAYIHGNVLSGLGNGTSIVNIADVGGVYDGQWIQAISRWVTKVYAKTIPSLPKTGY